MLKLAIPNELITNISAINNKTTNIKTLYYSKCFKNKICYVKMLSGQQEAFFALILFCTFLFEMNKKDNYYKL